MNRSADYDTDILEWSEQQASALRGLARARPDLSNELDWENVAEEIECVGRSEFIAVLSYIRQILIHLIKAISFPNADLTLHWRKEVGAFRGELLDRITPSMRVRIDLSKLWRQASKQAELDLAVHGQSVAAAVPKQCPLLIDVLLDPEFDFLKVVESVREQIDDGSPSV